MSRKALSFFIKLKKKGRGIIIPPPFFRLWFEVNSDKLKVNRGKPN